MIKKLLLLFALLLGVLPVFSIGIIAIKKQSSINPGDSVVVKVHPKYNSVSKFHRFLFGENYRKEWAADTKLPVIRLSKFQGGLTPIKEGGGFQTHSLRLVDKTGKEWVLRGVEKSPEKILPPEFQETFAKDWVNDAMSAQHPFSALIVPPLADAAHVPHANPIIGVVLADPALGEYSETFVNKVCLIEEREPTGKSDNTEKLVSNLLKDNDNTVDKIEFLRARLLDLLIGDWDRHSDQWRWTKEDKGKGDMYTAVPRDRDQVVYTNQGVFPSIAAQPWLAPNLQGFNGKIYDVRYSIWKTMFMDRFLHYNHDEWTKTVNDFIAAETDEVLEAGLRRLPESSYKLRHDVLLRQLKERRANIPAAMEAYYRFAYQIVDIHTTNKNELFTINNTKGGELNITINKISKEGNIKDTLMSTTYNPDYTKEIRLYVGGGSDSVVLNNSTSPIKLRFIDSTGTKAYNIVKSMNTVQLYDRGKKLTITGDESKVNQHISKDSANTAYLKVNLFNTIMPLANIEVNPDEGVLFGAGFKYVHQKGFRKLPYNDVQTVFASHSFTTNAFKIRYSGDWIQAVGKADFQLQAEVEAPGSINFFGRGNESIFNKTGDYKTYYRTRYNTFRFDPALNWHNAKGTSLSVGPSFIFYKLDGDDNTGRFITNPLLTHSPDSYTFDKDKMHAGVVVNFTSDKRNNKILPTSGSYVNIILQQYTGLNNYSTSFAQFIPEVAFYQSLNSKKTVVLADRVGGGITVGKTAFYQSLFLGGQGNLLGYRLYRFSGQDSFYNNFELRVKLADFATYIVPGQIGLLGFYDVGRVWENGQHSDKWHNGTGGGLYVAPARLAVIKIIAGYSEEGWYPYLSTSFRF